MLKYLCSFRIRYETVIVNHNLKNDSRGIWGHIPHRSVSVTSFQYP